MPVYKRIVIKVGSNVITRENGLPDEAIFAAIAQQIAGLKKQGVEVILVSSGAVASGRNLIPDSVRWSKTVQRQVLAAAGQPRLMRLSAGHQGGFSGQIALPEHEKLPAVPPAPQHRAGGQ